MPHSKTSRPGFSWFARFGEDPGMQQARWFYIFWNLAALVSSGFPGIHSNLVVDVLVVGSSLLCLVLPPGQALLFFLFTQLAVPLFYMPLIGNNVTVRAVVVFFLFLDWAWTSVGKRQWTSLLETIQTNAAPLRVAAAFVYLISGIHKLNAGFLNTDDSCFRVTLEQTFGDPFHSSALTPHGFLPAWLIAAGIFLTLILELGAPTLLFLERFRPWVVAALIIFHTFLSLNFLDFSLTQFGFLCLFIPERVLAQCAERIQSSGRKGALVGALFIASGILSHFWPLYLSYLSPAIPHSLLPTLFLLWALFAGLRSGLFRGFFSSPNPFPTPRPGYFSRLTFAGLVLLGASPYLGLRTSGTLSMFSNLRVLNGSNHLFLPSLALLPEEARLLEIDSTDNLYLQGNYVKPHQLLTKIDLERISALLVHRGVHYKVSYHEFSKVGAPTARVDSDSAREIAAFAARPYWERKLVAFRSVPGDSADSCQW